MKAFSTHLATKHRIFLSQGKHSFGRSLVIKGNKIVQIISIQSRQAFLVIPGIIFLGKSRDYYGPSFIKWANSGLFLFIFILFKHNFYSKNFRFHLDLNSIRQNRRQARWPLDHHGLLPTFCTFSYLLSSKLTPITYELCKATEYSFTGQCGDHLYNVAFFWVGIRKLL